MQITMDQYQDWLDRRMYNDNPLRHVAPDQYSCYIDYKYIKDIFSENSEVFKVIIISFFFHLYVSINMWVLFQEIY